MLPPKSGRQTVLFSATFPANTKELCDFALRPNPTLVDTVGEDTEQTARRVSCCTMRFGSTAKVLLKCKLKYYRISECLQGHGAQGRAASCTMRFGSTAQVLLKCKLRYYTISECLQGHGAQGRAASCTMRFGSTAQVLLKCKLKYYTISECAAVCLAFHHEKRGHPASVLVTCPTSDLKQG